MAALTEYRFAAIEGCAEALAEALGEGLCRGIAERGWASLVLSGGRTPRHILPLLARRQVPWQHVHVTLTDERWVAPDHPDSNEKLVRDTLLAGDASAARFVAMKSAEESPGQAVFGCAARLAGVPRPFDAVLLGMGEDGHVASLFPHCPALAAGDGPCVATESPLAVHPRMSLTASTLLDARKVFLVLVGAAKAAVYDRARGPGPAADLPLRLILHQDRTPVDVYLVR